MARPRRWGRARCLLPRCLMLLLSLAPLAVVAGGCQPDRRYPRGDMFGPSSMRVHPIFTRYKDWTGDNGIDGIEAVVELQDQFGEPTRATGRVMFELYDYRQDFPEPRGRRIGGPWIVPLTTKEEQQRYWSKAVRGYSFQLGAPRPEGRGVVLLATFHFGNDEAETQGAKGRLFDELILEKK